MNKKTFETAPSFIQNTAESGNGGKFTSGLQREASFQGKGCQIHYRPKKMRTGRLKVFTLFLLIIPALSCTKRSEVKSVCRDFLNKTIVLNGVSFDYPKDNTLFPIDFQSPTFRWTDTSGTSSDWYVCISDTLANILLYEFVPKQEWKPDSLKWESLKQNNIEEKLQVTVIGFNSKRKQFAGVTQSFQISKDSVGADIFFRAVTLPFSYAVRNVQTIEWYMGSPRGEAPRKMLDNMPVCANCHSFSVSTPTLAMDVDYGNDKGSYALARANDTCSIRPENIISWSSFKKDEGEPTFGLLSQISPSGKYLLSTVKDLSVFAAVDDNLAYSQLFFPIKGIIGIYNVESKCFSELQGANNPDFVQSNPVWSPDNKKVLFARTDAYINEKVKKSGTALLDIDDVKEFKQGGKEFKFNIYSVDFNDGLGGESKPLRDASYNGKSNYFPKYSPDGRWIVFCQAENFMLLQPDSKLFIMKADGTGARLMNCNMDNMNSWHSWSPNGRWLVFSSKDESLYTRLYLTHIDEDGNDSPPILLENLVFDQRAANIPEFFPGKAPEFKTIRDDFSNTASYYARLATDNIKSQYYLRAEQNLNRAIQLDPDYIDTYILKILLNSILQQVNSRTEKAEKEKALSIVDSLLSTNKGDDELQFLKASILSANGQNDKALTILNSIMDSSPAFYRACELRATIYKKQNKPELAISTYRKMISLVPSNEMEISQLIALLYLSNNNPGNALILLKKMLEKYPGNEEIHENLCSIYIRNKNIKAARNEIELLYGYDSTNYKYYLMDSEIAELAGEKEKAKECNGRGISLLQLDLQQNRENFPLYFEMAGILQKNKDLKGAAECLDVVLRDLPSNYKALKEKARIMLMMQQWQDAINLYEKLLSHYNPEEEFYNNAAIASIKTGNYEEALNNFNNTLKLNPSDTDALYNRSRLYEILGRPQ
jgi:tetratricopeptide (TPR) repeat protein